MPGGSKSDNVTQTTEPWAGQREHLTDIFTGAQGLYEGSPLQYFPGQTYAQWSPRTQEALGMMRQRARSGSPLQRAGTEAMRATASGEMLGANPYLDATYERAARPMTRMFREATAPSIAARMSGSGRAGSPAARQMQEQAQDVLGAQPWRACHRYLRAQLCG